MGRETGDTGEQNQGAPPAKPCRPAWKTAEREAGRAREVPKTPTPPLDYSTSNSGWELLALNPLLL
jgi:hypothetical protein